MSQKIELHITPNTEISIKNDTIKHDIKNPHEYLSIQLKNNKCLFIADNKEFDLSNDTWLQINTTTLYLKTVKHIDNTDISRKTAVNAINTDKASSTLINQMNSVEESNAFDLDTLTDTEDQDDRDLINELITTNYSENHNVLELFNTE